MEFVYSKGHVVKPKIVIISVSCSCFNMLLFFSLQAYNKIILGQKLLSLGTHFYNDYCQGK